MGRLLRRKPSIIKKRKTAGEDEASENHAGAEGAGDVSVSVPAAKEIRRPAAPASKPASFPRTIPDFRGKVYIEKAVQFLREVKVELKKVAWPSRKQTIGSTAVVIVLVMIISLFLGIVDMGLSGMVRLVLQ